MDVMYGWEVTLLEPTSFWDGVPDEISQSYHFYNVPISSNITASSNPLRIIKDIATLDDFVSFKLDVDTPTVVMNVDTSAYYGMAFKIMEAAKRAKAKLAANIKQ